MKKDKKMIKLVIMLTAVFISNVFAYDITTGGTNGTYFKFGKEIKRYVANKVNMDMEVLTSNGSVDNINKMSTEENIRFAIVQHDVINSFRESSNKRSKMLVRNTKVLLPLYYEEIHFVVKRNSSMQFIKDIKNKKINAGKEGSGTFMTTTMFYKEMFNNDIDFNNLTNYGSKKALEELKKGNIDVVVVVSGQPSGTLANLNSNYYKLLKRHSSSTSSIYYDNPKFQCGKFRVGADIPPNFGRFGDTAGIHQRVHISLIVIVRCKRRGDTRARQVFKNYTAIRFETGVVPVPKRRAIHLPRKYMGQPPPIILSKSWTRTIRRGSS